MKRRRDAVELRGKNRTEECCPKLYVANKYVFMGAKCGAPG